MKKPFNPPGNFDVRAAWAGQECAEINAAIERQIEKKLRGENFGPEPDDNTFIGAPSAPPPDIDSEE
jgi:hypothetical protein